MLTNSLFEMGDTHHDGKFFDFYYNVIDAIQGKSPYAYR